MHDLAICTRSVQSSQKRRFHHYDSDCCLNNTWPSLHTDRIDRAAVSPTTLAALAPASHTSSTSVCRFHACKLHRFHQRSASAGLSFLQITPDPSGFHAVVRILDILHGVRAHFIWRLHAAFLSPSADRSHLKWKSQMVHLTTPSGSL